MTSKRLSAVPASPIRKLVPYATVAKAQGVKVYHLNIGDPDIETPDEMLSVLRNWTRKTVGYDQSQGNPELLKSLVWYYKKIGFDFIHESNIQVATGGSEALSMAIFATCDPGDEVLVFEPFYANYNGFAASTGVTLVPIRTKIEDGFHLPKRVDIEAKITQKTIAILFCNPNNPTGTVYTKKEIELLVELAKKHNLFLLADEVYREFTYDGAKQVSLLTYMQEIPELAVVLDSLSKRYSLCGGRIGMVVSRNTELMAGVLRMAQARLSSGLVDQLMAAELPKVSDAYFRQVNKEYEARRDVLFEGLSKIPGVTIPKPEGAFYAIVGLPVDDAEKFCTWLLTDFRDNNETVMLAPAAGFYASPGIGKNEVRIAYVINQTSLKRCIEILRLALQNYLQ